MAYAKATIPGVTAVETARTPLRPQVSRGGTRSVLIHRVAVKQKLPAIDPEQPDTGVGYRVRLFDHPTSRLALLELVVPTGGQEAPVNRPDAVLPNQAIRAQTYTGHLYATVECVGPVGEGFEKSVLIEVMTSRLN